MLGIFSIDSRCHIGFWWKLLNFLKLIHTFTQRSMTRNYGWYWPLLLFMSTKLLVVVWTSHVHCQRVFRNKPCYAFKYAHLSESITSEILGLWGSFFFKKLEISCRFQKYKKNQKKTTNMPQKISAFLDNLIWIDNGKFSQLIREYSELAGNVLSSSP